MPKSDQKPPKESAAEMVQVVLPNDANPLGNILGGRVMHWIDLVGAVVASRHSHRPVVTASMERLDFHSPIRVGYIVLLKGSLHYVGKTSMEVGVEVYSEDPRTGQRTHTSSAILTYVALDDNGKPTSVPKLLLETDEEKRCFKAAEERRLKRMQQKR
ncbi:MAG TPA: acyl-CoA thioesterase [Nitrospiria bacterium]|nr:acyl-CoA thioesterase [Nitrospiria bacterium]